LNGPQKRWAIWPTSSPALNSAIHKAADLLDTIKRGAELLTFVPLAFRTGRVAGTREYPVHPNYILIYQVGKTSIEILRVLHGKRQYP